MGLMRKLRLREIEFKFLAIFELNALNEQVKRETSFQFAK